jgi:hypothetical protein
MDEFENNIVEPLDDNNIATIGKILIHFLSVIG